MIKYFEFPTEFEKFRGIVLGTISGILLALFLGCLIWAIVKRKLRTTEKRDTIIFHLSLLQIILLFIYTLLYSHFAFIYLIQIARCLQLVLISHMFTVTASAIISHTCGRIIKILSFIFFGIFICAVVGSLIYQECSNQNSDVSFECQSHSGIITMCVVFLINLILVIISWAIIHRAKIVERSLYNSGKSIQKRKTLMSSKSKSYVGIRNPNTLQNASNSTVNKGRSMINSSENALKPLHSQDVLESSDSANYRAMSNSSTYSTNFEIVNQNKTIYTLISNSRRKELYITLFMFFLSTTFSAGWNILFFLKVNQHENETCSEVFGNMAFSLYISIFILWGISDILLHGSLWRFFFWNLLNASWNTYTLIIKDTCSPTESLSINIRGTIGDYQQYKNVLQTNTVLSSQSVFHSIAQPNPNSNSNSKRHESSNISDL